MTIVEIDPHSRGNARTQTYKHDSSPGAVLKAHPRTAAGKYKLAIVQGKSIDESVLLFFVCCGVSRGDRLIIDSERRW